MTYQLVIKRGLTEKFWAFLVPATTKVPSYEVGMNYVTGKSVKDVIKKAKKIVPENGVIGYIYLDAKGR